MKRMKKLELKKKTTRAIHGVTPNLVTQIDRVTRPNPSWLGDVVTRADLADDPSRCGDLS